MDNKQSKLNLLPFILIFTDGYNINTNRYSYYDSAYEAMKADYNSRNRNETDDEWDDMSYLCEYGSCLYDCGENVYVWRIENLNE